MYNIEEILIDNIYKLGTKIESYLGNFYNYLKESKKSEFDDKKKFLNFEFFLNKNGSGVEKRTIEQNKGVFDIFNILKNKENFNESFFLLKSFDDFKNLLLKNMQIKINDYYKYLDNKYFLSILIKLLINKGILSKKNFNEELIEYLRFFDLSNSKKGYDYLFKNFKINFTEEDFINNFMKHYKINFNKIEKIENKFKNQEKYHKKEKIVELEDRQISVINLIDFLKDEIKSNSFFIPFYQRRYVWEKNNIKNLFISILEKDVFLNLNSIHINTRFRKTNLVDGQQRLTSLIIILQNLLNEEENINFLINNDFIKDSDFLTIKKNISYYFDLLKNHLRIDSKEIDSIFRRNILPKRKNKNKSLLYSNFEFIKKFLNNYSKEEKINILYKIFGVEFILVHEENKNDVLKFLELNSNSKSLTNYELSKSYLIFFSKEKNSEYDIRKKIENFEKYFFNKKGTLNEDKIDIFLSSYLKIKKLEDIKDSNYFLSFKKYIEEINNIQELIEDLGKYLNYFLIINDNNFDLTKNNHDREIFNSLSDILFTFRKQKIYLSILMYFLNLNYDKNFFEIDIIRFFLFKLEIFHFKWKIIKFRGESLSEVMLKLLININKALKSSSNLDSCFEQENVKFIKDVLSISNDEFICELKKFEFKDNDLPLKIIVRIENYDGKIIFEKKDQNNLIKWDYKSLTLEHIYPKNSKNKILKMEDVKNNLLNLMFLQRNLNQSVNNDSPYLKYDKYIKYNAFKFNKSLLIFKDNKEKFKDEFIFDTLKTREKELSNTYKDFLDKIYFH